LVEPSLVYRRHSPSVPIYQLETVNIPLKTAREILDTLLEISEFIRQRVQNRVLWMAGANTLLQSLEILDDIRDCLLKALETAGIFHCWIFRLFLGLDISRESINAATQRNSEY
jgi:hypothetical protein